MCRRPEARTSSRQRTAPPGSPCRSTRRVTEAIGRRPISSRGATHGRRRASGAPESPGRRARAAAPRRRSPAPRCTPPCAHARAAPASPRLPRSLRCRGCSERNDGAQDRQRDRRPLRKLPDEDLVDFDLVELEPPQVAQRRVAGAEVVERDPHADFVQLAERLRHLLALLQQNRLGDLDLEPLRQDLRGAERADDGVAHVAGAELGGREVHRDL